jgi:hypothetical protein
MNMGDVLKSTGFQKRTGKTPRWASCEDGKVREVIMDGEDRDRAVVYAVFEMTAGGTTKKETEDKLLAGYADLMKDLRGRGATAIEVYVRTKPTTMLGIDPYSADASYMAFCLFGYCAG